MIRPFQLLLITVILASCAKTQTEFQHTIASTEGISDAEITYASAGANAEDSSAGTHKLPLKNGMEIIPRLSDTEYSILITDGVGITLFEQIPAKFINMNATVEVTRNVFQPYFPEEWSPMKGSQFSTLYIKNVDDEAVFYLKTVVTGTNKEIGKHSEDH